MDQQEADKQAITRMLELYFSPPIPPAESSGFKKAAKVESPNKDVAASPPNKVK
jgi:hypothetical protein